MNLKNLLTVMCFIFMLSPKSHGGDDVQWWSAIYARVWEKDAHSLTFYAENWMVDDASEQKLWLASARYGYAVHPNLDLGVNYTYLQIRNIQTDTRNSKNRYEVEVNPHFKLDDNWKFYLRNRLEVACDDELDHTAQLRSRHRFQFSRKLDVGYLTKFYVNSEFFYDYENDRWSENRTVPAGVQLKFGDLPKFNLHYMIQSKRIGRTDEWDTNHILGTTLVLKF